MTVKELIAVLEKMPQEAKIEVPDWYSDDVALAEFAAVNEDNGKITVRMLP